MLGEYLNYVTLFWRRKNIAIGRPARVSIASQKSHRTEIQEIFVTKVLAFSGIPIFFVNIPILNFREMLFDL